MAVLTADGTMISVYNWAFDNPIFKKNSNGELEYVFYTSKIVDITDKLNDFLNGTEDVYFSDNYTDCQNIYRNDRALITMGCLDDTLRWTDLNSDFGIIPYPKWNEEQSQYYTIADGSHSVLAIPLTVRDSERTGIIAETLCAESWKVLIPTYYDVALKYRGARDDESMAMLDMIRNSCVYDFGYIFDGWKGTSYFLSRVLMTTDGNFSSYYESNYTGALNYYDKILATFSCYYD